MEQDLEPAVRAGAEHDDYLQPPAAREALRRRASHSRDSLRGSRKHLWVGEKSVRQVLNTVVSIVTGTETELPPSTTVRWQKKLPSSKPHKKNKGGGLDGESKAAASHSYE